MSNYTLNNIKRLSFQIEESDYWDMHINNDDLGSYSFTGIEKNEECLSSYIDASLSECVQGNELISSSAYTWDCATNNGLLLENIGFTGIDNGLILYKKDRITNQEFYDIYTNSEYSIPSEDFRLHLHMVSGNTYLYDYPVTIEPLKIKLNGGFYQGFFRTNDDYYIMPATIKKEWNLEFKLKKHEYEPESEKTLNTIHPNNKGIFFYIGTRAENKWIELYNESSIPSGITSTLDRGIQFGENCPIISGNPFDEMNNHYSGETKESGETSISYSYDDHGSWYTHDGISNYPINSNHNIVLDDEEFDVEWDEPMNENGEACYIEGEEPSNNFVEEELDLHSVKYETKKGISIDSANEDIIETPFLKKGIFSNYVYLEECQRFNLNAFDSCDSVEHSLNLIFSTCVINSDKGNFDCRKTESNRLNLYVLNTRDFSSDVCLEFLKVDFRRFRHNL